MTAATRTCSSVIESTCDRIVVRCCLAFRVLSTTILTRFDLNVFGLIRGGFAVAVAVVTAAAAGAACVFGTNTTFGSFFFAGAIIT